MQLFLIGYIIISICEIFTIGGFPLNGDVRRVSSYDRRLLHLCSNKTGLFRSAHRSSCRNVLDSHDERSSRVPGLG